MTDIELIKSKLDIVEIVGKYVELKRSGSNYKANCPFHNEKTASFMVNPSLQIYKCFGCGKGGDVLRFIEEIERVDFREAVRIAAEKAGVEIQNFSFKKNEKEEALKKRIIAANTLTVDFYSYILKSHAAGKRGRDYAAKRGLTSKEIETFKFGFAPNSVDSLKNFLTKKGFSESELLSFGLVVERRGLIDKFRNRLMQPVFNVRGEVVGFSGRYIGTDDRAPKYLNSPETIVFKKNELLYGLYQAIESVRQEKKIILVEGNLDVVSSQRAGVANVVAPLGTAFTEHQAGLIKRYADELLFCFDNDKAGISALIRSLKIVEDLGVLHKVIDLGNFKDCDEMIKENPKLWLEAVKNPKNTVHYIFSKMSEGLDLGNSDDKINFRNKIVPILRMLKDDVELNHFLKEASILLEVSQDDLIKKIKNEKLRMKNDEGDVDINANVAIEDMTNPDDSSEKYFLALFVQTKYFSKAEIAPETFTNSNISALIKVLNEIKAELQEQNLKALDQRQIDLYKEAVIRDLSNVQDLEKELQVLYKRLMYSYLKKEILNLRKKLIVNEEDSETMQRLSELTKELKELK